MMNKYLFIASVLIILLGVAIILFSGKRFADMYLKSLGGEDRFDYKKWKACYVASVLLFGTAAIFWSFNTLAGPVIAIVALIMRPVLTFTVCRKRRHSS